MSLIMEVALLYETSGNFSEATRIRVQERLVCTKIYCLFNFRYDSIWNRIFTNCLFENSFNLIQFPASRTDKDIIKVVWYHVI